MEVDVQVAERTINMKREANKVSDSVINPSDRSKTFTCEEMNKHTGNSVKRFLDERLQNKVQCKKDKKLRFGIENILNKSGSTNKNNRENDDETSERDVEVTGKSVSAENKVIKSPLPPTMSNPFLLDTYYGATSTFQRFVPCITNPDVLWSWRETHKEKFNLTRRVGHPYQNRTPPKRKKPRTSFTRLTIMELEKRFERQKYLASSERSSLAKVLKISDSQVKTWFQNRRTKWRRQAAEEKEIERQTAKRLIMTMSSYSTPKTVQFNENVCVGKIVSPEESWVRQQKSTT